MILENKAGFAGIIDTRIQEADFQHIAKSMFPSWNAVANYAYSTRGCIWIIWDPYKVNFTTQDASEQAIHGQVDIIGGLSLYVTVVYAGHTYMARRPLWEDISSRSGSLDSTPWLILGDFNAILDRDERDGGSSVWTQSANDLRNCLSDESFRPSVCGAQIHVVKLFGGLKTHYEED